MYFQTMQKLNEGRTDFHGKEWAYLGPHIADLEMSGTAFAALLPEIKAHTRKEIHEKLDYELFARLVCADDLAVDGLDAAQHSAADAERSLQAAQLFASFKPEQWDGAFTAALAQIARRGDVAALQNILAMMDNLTDEGGQKLWQSLLLAESGDIFIKVIQDDDLALLRTLYDFINSRPDEERIPFQAKMKQSFINVAVALHAAHGGHGEILQYAYEQARAMGDGDAVFRQYGTQILYNAAVNGHVSVLRAAWKTLRAELGADALAQSLCDGPMNVYGAAMRGQDIGAIEFLHLIADDLPAAQAQEFAAITPHLYGYESRLFWTAAFSFVEHHHGADAIEKILRADDFEIWRLAAQSKDKDLLFFLMNQAQIYAGGLAALMDADGGRFFEHVLPEARIEQTVMIGEIAQNLGLGHHMRAFAEGDMFPRLERRNDYGEILATYVTLLKDGKGPVNFRITQETHELMLGVQSKLLKKSDYWQMVGGGDLRWLSVMNMTAPDGLSPYASPFNFKPKLYDEILPDMQDALAHDSAAKLETAVVYAYRLSCLFANRQEVARYLAKDLENRNRTIRKAMDFDVPQRGLWTPAHWKNLGLRYGRNGLRFLEVAPKIEEYCRENKRDLPARPEDVEDIAKNIYYKRADEHPELARMMIESGQPNNVFERGLGLLADAAKAEDNLPELVVDGTDVGQRDYYLAKLPRGDARALMLGEMTNCCQSLGGNGEYAVTLGMLAPQSGFYVWRRKTGGEMTPQDKIVAQSWVWMPKRGKAMVFDSFERIGPSYNRLLQPFIEQLAFDARKGGIATRVFVGTGGNSPLSAAFNKVACPVAWPFEDVPQVDSLEAYQIIPRNHRAPEAQGQAPQGQKAPAWSSQGRGLALPLPARAIS